MRPPEPSFVIAWREFDKKGPPKCCHTCDQGGLNVQTLEEMVANLNQTEPPRSIEFKRDGKFFRVMRRRWE